MLRRLKYLLWAFRNWLRGDYEGGRFSYGQFAEDILIWEALRRSGNKTTNPKAIRYLDLGANHPSRLSNTMFAYQRGATGVLVEPNPALAKLLAKRRPKDTVLAVGVGPRNSDPLEFFLFDPDVLSTFSADAARQYEQNGYKCLDRVEVPIVSIADLIEDHFSGAPPDFVSLDIEGLDESIIAAIDWSVFRPTALCIETWDMLAMREIASISDTLKAAGYSVFAKVGPNTVFILPGNQA